MGYTELASGEKLELTAGSLQSKGYEVLVVKTKEEALVQVKALIPQGASVINGSSVTLEQIGFIDYLKSTEHKWRDLHAVVAAENDPVKRKVARRQATVADFYLGSVHALLQNGEFIIASNTASQLASVVFSAVNLIFVVSTKKIVPDFDSGMKRLTEYVYGLEDAQSKQKYGEGTELNKIVIFKGENEHSGRKIHFILIEEDLGF